MYILYKLYIDIFQSELGRLYAYICVAFPVAYEVLIWLSSPCLVEPLSIDSFLNQRLKKGY